MHEDKHIIRGNTKQKPDSWAIERNGRKIYEKFIAELLKHYIDSTENGSMK